MGVDLDKPKSGTKSKISRKRIEQIEQYVEEIDDNAKQFAGFYLLGGRAGGEASSQMSQLPPKSFTDKKFTAISNKDLF